MKLEKFTGEGVRISPSAQIGKNVKIGDRTIIYDNVVIGGIALFYSSEKKRREIEELAKKEGIEVIYKLYDKMINKNHLRRADYIQATFWKLKKEYVISITKVNEE